QRLSLAAVAGLSGFTVHHLVDMPAMMPAIALVGIVLILYLAMMQQPIQLRWKPIQLSQPILIILFWGILLISGWWSSEQYRKYILILSAATRSDGYIAAAQDLQSLIDADPSMAIYQMQQAFLYGMAAVDNPEYTDDAIAAYEKFLQLEPNHAVSWANLAALYKQAGHDAEALTAIERALELAPQAKLFQRNLMVYQSEQGDIVFYEPNTLWVEDYPVGVNFSRFQYLREALGRQYLPQVGAPE
ncbi:MAG: tetratricopeptide repeat protein, partial [Chloroflexi bacterium]